jgi:hypothetical protein
MANCVDPTWAEFWFTPEDSITPLLTVRTLRHQRRRKTSSFSRRPFGGERVHALLASIPSRLAGVVTFITASPLEHDWSRQWSAAVWGGVVTFSSIFAPLSLCYGFSARTDLINRRRVRCQRFAATARRGEGEYPQGPSTDEQRSGGAKDRQPGGLASGNCLAALLLRLKALKAMLLRRASPASRQLKQRLAPVPTTGHMIPILTADKRKWTQMVQGGDPAGLESEVECQIQLGQLPHGDSVFGSHLRPSASICG